MVNPRSNTIRFGVFEIDLRAGELRERGVKIKLQEQPFQVLALLLQRPGEVVTRDELRRALWTDDTFVDFDHRLNTAVNKIRETLGDSASHPRFVETLPRRGYRFIYPVDGTVERAPAGLRPDEPQNGETTVPGPPNVPPRRRDVRWVGLAAALILAAGALSWYWLTRPAHLEPPVEVPFTSFPGAEWAPSLSPDGQSVAFIWNGEGRKNYDIYIKRVDSEPVLQLTTNLAIDFSPAWSPDGNWIAFARMAPERLDAFLVPVLGGPERELAELTTLGWKPETPDSEPGNRNIWGSRLLSWSPDGSSVAIVHKSSPGEPFQISSLSIDTREKRRLTSASGAAWGDSYPAYSPDGGYLAFVRFPSHLVGDIYLLPLNRDGTPGGKARRLTNDRLDIRGLDWTSDGRGIVFSTNRGGARRLWKIAISGGEPEILPVGGANASLPSVSRQGHRLVYERETLDRNIWRTVGPMVAGGKSDGELHLPHKLIDSSRADSSPHYSPEGHKIVFDSNRSGTEELWICDSDGSNPIRFTSFGGPPVGSPEWSPDGEWIAFDSRKEGSADIYVNAVSGGAPRRLTTHPDYDGNPSWSPDSQWIYFFSRRTGVDQVWKVSVEGGEAVQVTRNGGGNPVVSSDGRFVYYVKRSVEGVWKGVWRRPVGGGDEKKILDEGRPDSWVLLKEGICFLDEASRAIQFFKFQTGETRSVAVLPEDARIFWRGLSVSPDGRWALYVQDDLAASDVILAENFQ